MGYSGSEVRAVTLACCISGFIAPLLSTMMNLSLIHIGNDFGVGSHDLAYINTSFLLASVIFMVPFAKAADILGKKRVFYIGLLIIVAGCIMASLAPNFWFVVIGRGITGCGAAGLVTVSVSMITDIVPKERRGSALGYQTMCVYTGLAIGPVIGGVMNDIIGWRLLFLIPLPFAIASIIIMQSGFKGDIATDKGGIFDTWGSIVYGLAMTLSMFGVMNLPATWSYFAIIVGLVLLAIFVKMQLNNKHCLLEMRLFKNWMFSGSCIATFMSYASSYSISFFMALYLQSVGAMTATEAGLFMICEPVAQAIFTPICGRLTDRISNKTILPTAGMAITAFSVLTIAFYTVDTPLYLIAVTLISLGIGFAMFSAPNTFLIMSSVPRDQTSAASGVLAVMRQSGMMVSMGIAMLYISIIMGSADNLVPETYDLFMEVIRYSFLTCFFMCVIGTITSAVRGKPKKC